MNLSFLIVCEDVLFNILIVLKNVVGEFVEMIDLVFLIIIRLFMWKRRFIFFFWLEDNLICLEIVKL